MSQNQRIPTLDLVGVHEAFAQVVVSSARRLCSVRMAADGLELFDLGAAAPLARLEGALEIPTVAAMSPDGARLALGTMRGALRLHDPRTGALLAELAGHLGQTYALAFSPEGKRLASAAQDETLRLWDVERGDELLVLRGHDSYVKSLAFAPDGSWLASASGDGTLRVWDTIPRRARLAAASAR